MKTTNLVNLQSTKDQILLKAKDVIAAFTRTARLEEYLHVERYLFRISFESAWKEKMSKETRMEIDDSLYFRREILKTVYSCDIYDAETELQEVQECLDAVLSLLYGELSNMHQLLEDLLRELKYYYTSDWFDDDQENGDMVILYDQEFEGLLTNLEPILFLQRSARDS